MTSAPGSSASPNATSTVTAIRAPLIEAVVRSRNPPYSSSSRIWSTRTASKSNSTPSSISVARISLNAVASDNYLDRRVASVVVSLPADQIADLCRGSLGRNARLYNPHLYAGAVRSSMDRRVTGSVVSNHLPGRLPGQLVIRGAGRYRCPPPPFEPPSGSRSCLRAAWMPA